jgi:hypothetical protein
MIFKSIFLLNQFNFMKIRILLSLALLFALLTACSDDDKATKSYSLTIDSQKYDLSKANLYLLYEDEEDYLYRQYVITDGTSYENATFALEFELGTSSSDKITPGLYPQHSDWYDEMFDKVSYIEFSKRDSDGSYSETPYSGNNGGINIKGGTNVGETIEISFEGKLFNYGKESNVDTKFTFKGKVQEYQDPI